MSVSRAWMLVKDLSQRVVRCQTMLSHWRYSCPLLTSLMVAGKWVASIERLKNQHSLFDAAPHDYFAPHCAQGYYPITRSTRRRLINVYQVYVKKGDTVSDSFVIFPGVSLFSVIYILVSIGLLEFITPTTHFLDIIEIDMKPNSLIPVVQ